MQFESTPKVRLFAHSATAAQYACNYSRTDTINWYTIKRTFYAICLSLYFKIILPWKVIWSFLWCHFLKTSTVTTNCLVHFHLRLTVCSSIWNMKQSNEAKAVLATWNSFHNLKKREYLGSKVSQGVLPSFFISLLCFQHNSTIFFGNSSSSDDSAMINMSKLFLNDYKNGFCFNKSSCRCKKKPLHTIGHLRPSTCVTSTNQLLKEAGGFVISILYWLHCSLPRSYSSFAEAFVKWKVV